jgi:hypothetical protein
MALNADTKDGKFGFDIPHKFGEKRSTGVR